MKNNKKAFKSFNSIIFIRLFKFILIFVVILLLIFSVIIDKIMIENAKQQKIFQTEGYLNQISKKVTADKTLAEQIATDENLRLTLKDFSNETSLGKLKISREIYNLLENYRIYTPEVTDISIYTTMPCEFRYQGIVSLADISEKNQQNCFDIQGITLFDRYAPNFSDIDKPDREKLLVVCPIPLSGSDYKWFVYMRISKDYIFNSLFDAKTPGEYYITDNKGEILFSQKLPMISSSFENSDVNQMIYKKAANGKTVKHNAQSCIAACSQTNDFGWKLVSFSPLSEVITWRGLLIVWTLFLSLLFVAVCYKFSNIFAKIISSPLSRLNEAMRKGSPIENQSATSAEILELYDYYNNLLATQNKMFGEIENQQKKVLDAEMRALISQINPHFLYNTLNVISWKSMDANRPDICTIISKLGKLCRLNYKFKSTYCTLKDEITSISLYMDLQKECFNNSFDYSVEADNSVLRLVVPKFILQPIIENSIIHGFSQKLDNNGRITVSAALENGILTVSIKDNGIGIDTDTLEKLNKGSYFSEKYGLKNINERIKLSCGEEYGLSFASHSISGTTVTVTLPENCGEERKNKEIKNKA